MALRRDKSRTIGRVARVTRKSKAKPVSNPKSVGFLEDIESYSDPDARVKKEIKERRREEKRIKKGSE